MDLGWGCGYRNCQMLMTYLSKQREQNVPILDGVVNIKGLQLLVEKAWKEGTVQLPRVTFKSVERITNGE
jgi:hypothetical protein